MSTTHSEQNQQNMPPLAVVPYLAMDNATAAIAFYQKVFDAKVFDHHMAEDGKRVTHATLLINGGVVMLSDEFPEHTGGRRHSPLALGGSSVSIQLQLEDVDAVWNRAVAEGATVEMPLVDQYWGDRYGILRDPFGHRWALFKHNEKPPEDAQRW